MLHRAFGFPELAMLIQDLEGLFGAGSRFSPWELFRHSGEAKEFACLIDPPALNNRVGAQVAAFTLCSDKKQSFDSFLRQHGLESALMKIIIPAAEVQRVRDQLDLVGMSERSLFPGLDGVAAEIRRYYS
jgi:hypothetical protein